MTSASTEEHWPLVSVVIPIYNGEVMLPTLLESLSRLDYPAERLEVILVDNNSTDNTPVLLASSPHTVIFEERPGCGTARNAGIRRTQGQFIACTDVDCVVDPAWIKDLLAGFTSPEIGAVAGTIKAYALENPIERYEALRLQDPGHRPKHVFLPTACTANLMYRAEVFKRVGLLLDRSGGEETDLNWRMQSQTEYRICFLQRGGLIQHRYRSDIRSFCRSQRYKARTLVDLHRRWKLHVPTGRKELARSLAAIIRFLPKTLARAVAGGVLVEAIWEAYLDIIVPWTRFRGIREGWRA
jgi:glycosyltransferase involved in cell wall biosynthesis